MSESANERGKPWDGYAQSTEDREYMEILRKATKAVQAALAAKGIASALIGGTALQLVEGLPRTSRDLDFKVTRATTGIEDAVIESVNSIPGWRARTATEDDESRGHEGIVISSERTGWERATALDLIPGTLGGGDTVGVAPEWVCERGGVMTYPTHVLAQLKMNTLFGERPRKIAHDVFDVAWLMDKHGYLVDHEYRKALGRWLAQAEEERDTWIEVFRQEPDEDWGWDDTIRAISDGLDKANEIVNEAASIERRIREVHRRTGNAELTVTVDEYGGMQGTIVGGGGHAESCGRIIRSEVIAVALGAVGNLTKQEIPELVLSVEYELQRKRVLARAKGLS